MGPTALKSTSGAAVVLFYWQMRDYQSLMHQRTRTDSSQEHLWGSHDSVLLLMMVTLPSSPLPDWAGKQAIQSILLRHSLSHSSSPEIHPLEERGEQLSEPKGERGLPSPDFFHWLEDGSETLQVHNHETHLLQAMQKNRASLQLSSWISLTERSTGMSLNPIQARWWSEPSVYAWRHQREEHGKTMALPTNS